jgi:hypothetical protein
VCMEMDTKGVSVCEDMEQSQSEIRHPNHHTDSPIHIHICTYRHTDKRSHCGRDQARPFI